MYKIGEYHTVEHRNLFGNIDYYITKIAIDSSTEVHGNYLYVRFKSQEQVPRMHHDGKIRFVSQREEGIVPLTLKHLVRTMEVGFFSEGSTLFIKDALKYLARGIR